MNIHTIIVTYNGSKWIRKCLESVEAVTEIKKTFIIDNGSTDNTLDIVKEFKVKILKNNQNLGFGAANNLGIGAALNEGASHVFLLNQDAYLQPDAFQNFLNLSNLREEDCLFSFLQLNGDGSDFDFNWKDNYLLEENCPGFLRDYSRQNLKVSYDIRFTNAAAWLIPRLVIEKVGGFSPTFFHYGEDNNFVHRLEYHGFNIKLLPNSAVYHDRFRKESGYHDSASKKERTFLIRVSHPKNKQSRFRIEISVWRNFAGKAFRGSKEEKREAFEYIKMLRKLSLKDVIRRRNATRIAHRHFI